MSTDKLVEIANEFETKMLRIDRALGSIGKDDPRFTEYATAVDELDEAIADIRSAINHIHCSMADKIIWALNSQELRE